MTYNVIAAPKDGYMPRIADPRMGYFEQPLLDFQNDSESYSQRLLHRPLELHAGDAGRRRQANNPLIFTFSNDIPVEYRDVVRKALLDVEQRF